MDKENTNISGGGFDRMGEGAGSSNYFYYQFGTTHACHNAATNRA
jgi:hypothetical protein